MVATVVTICLTESTKGMKINSEATQHRGNAFEQTNKVKDSSEVEDIETDGGAKSGYGIAN